MSIGMMKDCYFLFFFSFFFLFSLRGRGKDDTSVSPPRFGRPCGQNSTLAEQLYCFEITPRHFNVSNAFLWPCQTPCPHMHRYAGTRQVSKFVAGSMSVRAVARHFSDGSLAKVSSRCVHRMTSPLCLCRAAKPPRQLLRV
jgi:hypothetical protein